MTNHVTCTLFFLLNIIMGWQCVSSFWIPQIQFISRYHYYNHYHHPSTQLRQLLVPPLYATEKSYHVQVQYEGKSCDIQVQQSETILEALERTGVADRFAVAEMPFDCRKGNCMTCSAKLVLNSHNKQQQQQQQQMLLSEENGLSPEISKHIQKHGYVLTCSSYVQGDGLIIELGQNHEIWQWIYQQRFENESTRIAARAALARLLRRKAEKNVEKWALEVEALFEKSGNNDNDTV